MNNEIRVTDRTGRILYGIRVQLNCTQEEFGRKIGVSQPTISAYELGKIKPTPEVIMRVSNWFGLDPKCVTGERPMNWSSL